MNCRQTRELISAYLDQELTGQQMLDIHAHLGACDDCAREWREIREVRRLLRALTPYCPAEAARERLSARLDREAALEATPFPATLILDWLSSLQGVRAALGEGARPHGRRLASALALSSVAVLAMAGPFAPPNSDAVGRSVPATAPRVAPVSASFGWVTLPTEWSSPFAPLHAPTAQTAALTASPQTYTQTAAQNMDIEPLRDEAVSGYVTLADGPSLAAGGR